MSKRAERTPAGSRARRTLLTRALRVGFAANNRGDYDAMVASLHPDVEFIPPGRGESGLDFEPVYRGPEGVRRFTEQWKSGFDDFRYEVREIADPGGARFGLRIGLIGTLRGSETQVEDEYGAVYTIEDGMAIRIVNFYDWDDALAELREPGSRYP